MPQKIGYARVSTEEQNLQRQLDWFTEQGVTRIFTDKLSGKDLNRNGFRDALEALEEGDTLYVESLSRIARSNRDLLDIIYDLDARGVHVVAQNDPIDMETKQGRFLISVLGAAAQMERETILEAQKNGVASAKKRGAYKGHVRRVDVDDEKLALLLLQWCRDDTNLSIRSIARQIGCAESTVRNRIKEYGLEKGTDRSLSDIRELQRKLVTREKKRFSKKYTKKET